MELELIMKFLNADLFIVCVALYFIGRFLKTSKVPDAYIPLTLLVLGISGCIVYSGVVSGLGFGAATLIVGVIQGIFCASACVFLDQNVKQLFVKQYTDKEDK